MKRRAIANGRDHLVDAYQEELDYTLYLRAWLDEHPKAPDEPLTVYLVRNRNLRRLREAFSDLWDLRHDIEALGKVVPR